MAFDIAKAVQTPFPDPDMSSPSNNFANLSFIMSISKQNPPQKRRKRQLTNNHKVGAYATIKKRKKNGAILKYELFQT
jgi:hypothetical protein